MNKKMLMRLICALLTVLTVVSVVPALTLYVAAEELVDDLPKNQDGTYDYTRFVYENEQARIDAMTKYYENEDYALYADDLLGGFAGAVNYFVGALPHLPVEVDFCVTQIRKGLLL